MRWGSALALGCALLGVMFQLRPGERELQRQIVNKKRSTGGPGLPYRGSHFAGEIGEELARMARDRSQGLAPVDLGSRKLLDFKVFTLAVPKKTKGIRFVGILGNFFSYRDEDDLFLLAFFSFCFFLAVQKWPGKTYKLCTPAWTNPASLVLSGFYTDSIMSLIMCCTSFISSGEVLQREVGRNNTLALILGTWFLASINELLSRRYPRPVGGIPASFSLITHATLLYPDMRYNLYGMSLNGFALIAVQIGLPMLTAPHIFWELFPGYLTGLLAGFASFCFWNERQAGVLFKRYGIPIGQGKQPSSLVLPILGLNLIFSQFAAQQIA